MSDSQILERTQRFLSFLRHCQVLGLSVEHADSKGLTLRLPYNESLICNPETGGIHGGISTACALPELEVCPTLDLRIDYMHPAEPGHDVFGFAECYRVTPHVIFTRGVAYQRDINEPIAHVVGTFMRMGKQAGGRGGEGAA